MTWVFSFNYTCNESCIFSYNNAWRDFCYISVVSVRYAPYFPTFISYSSQAT